MADRRRRQATDPRPAGGGSAAPIRSRRTGRGAGESFSRSLSLASIGPALFLLLAIAGTVAARAPELRLRFDLGWSDNLFLDSLETDDLSSTGSLLVRHDPTPALRAEAEIGRTGHSGTEDLGSTQGRVALRLGGGGERLERRWLSLESEFLAFGDDYELYDRRRVRLAGGLLWKTGPALRLKARAQTALSLYPSAPDSLAADNLDAGLALGCNLALDWPLAVDVEAGLQQQRYGDLPLPATTRHGWGTLRLSRPLGERLGLSLQGSLRRQFDTGDAERLALVDAGLDSGELLRDGWRVESGLAWLGGSWRSRLRLGYASDAYLGLAGLEMPAREDRTTALGLETRRAFDPATRLRIWLGLNAGWTACRSSDPLHDGEALRLGLDLQLEPH